jgi:hypothetical protein
MRRKLQKYATKENADVNDLDFSALEADKSPQRRNKGSRTTKPRAKKPDGTYEPGSMPTMIDGVQMPMLKPMGDHPQLVKAQATLGGKRWLRACRDNFSHGGDMPSLPILTRSLLSFH